MGEPGRRGLIATLPTLRERYSPDLIVANKVGGPFDAVGSEENKVTVFGVEGTLTDWPMLPKRQVAERLWDLIVDRYRKAHAPERPERPARSPRR